jgi:signal transduction histidine kinase
MKRTKEIFLRMRGILSRYLVEILGVLAILLFALSFHTPSYEAQLSRRVSRVERALQSRERVIEGYIRNALTLSPEVCLDMDDLPEDMVLYKYNFDTLHSWINEFPIRNDATDSYPFNYRLEPDNEAPSGVSPLALLGDQWQYCDLGSARFVVSKWYSSSRRTKIVAGIRTDRLPLGAHFRVAELTENPPAVVHSIDGTPLFSVVPDSPEAFISNGLTLKWFSLLAALLALFALHFKRPSWRTFGIAFAGLSLIRLAAVFLSGLHDPVTSLFSPILYADNMLFPTLGDFLLNNVYVASVAYLLFAVRFPMMRAAERAGRRFPPARIAATSALFLAAAALALYLFWTLRSLILNSTLVLEPYRINEFTGATLLCYLTFAMLALALLFVLQTGLLMTRRLRRVSLFSWRNLILGTILVSLFFVVAQGIFGVKREYESNRVITAKLAVEHDLPFELYLRGVEQAISEDPFIATLVSVKAGELIRNRLIDRYFYKELLDNYDVRLSICAANDYLPLGSQAEPVLCFPFFHDILAARGTRLDQSTHFYQVNNYDGKLAYLGLFQYYDPDGRDLRRLYLTFTSKRRHAESAAGPLPGQYSYACYNDRRLVASEGNVSYPVVLPEEYRPGYSMVGRGGVIHFINRYSEADATILSRQSRPWLPYLVSFSYLLIFFGIFLIIFTSRDARGRFLDLPKHSIKRKITLLTTGVMLATLAAVGGTAISYNVRFRHNANAAFMEERIAAVQGALSEKSHYYPDPEGLSSPDFIEEIRQLSEKTRYEIGIYDIRGSLIYSTVSETSAGGTPAFRLSHHAYHEIVHMHATRFSEVVEEGSRNYYAVYAPLFNLDGELLGIVYVPYRSRSSGTVTGHSLVMFINLYLVLIIASLIIGVLLSNSISRPIREVRDQMRAAAASPGRLTHIPYKNSRDELGVLVHSYNDMVDALEESRRLLAQSEREQAWKEMARRIAHEIKNALSPMRLSIQHLIRLKQRGIPGWEEKVEQIGGSLISQIDVLAETASEFSAIARTADDVATEVDLNALLREQMIIFDNRPNLTLKYRCNVTEPIIMGRRRQLSRVFTNLITNAIQAIEESRGSGRIALSLTREPAEEGASYVVRVEDDGPGVPPENIDRIFTSNFTTRSSGSGLGLSISKGIVEQSGGTIACSRSESLGGACFTVRFPAVS